MSEYYKKIEHEVFSSELFGRYFSWHINAIFFFFSLFSVFVSTPFISNNISDPKLYVLIGIFFFWIFVLLRIFLHFIVQSSKYKAVVLGFVNLPSLTLLNIELQNSLKASSDHLKWLIGLWVSGIFVYVTIGSNYISEIFDSYKNSFFENSTDLYGQLIYSTFTFFYPIFLFVGFYYCWNFKKRFMNKFIKDVIYQKKVEKEKAINY